MPLARCPLISLPANERLATEGVTLASSGYFHAQPRGAGLDRGNFTSRQEPRCPRPATLVQKGTALPQQHGQDRVAKADGALPIRRLFEASSARLRAGVVSRRQDRSPPRITSDCVLQTELRGHRRGGIRPCAAVVRQLCVLVASGNLHVTQSRPASIAAFLGGGRGWVGKSSAWSGRPQPPQGVMSCRE